MPTHAGPACGWVMAYVETLLSTYPTLELSSILGGRGAPRPLPLAAGLALLEARHSRLDPGHAIGWVDRAVMRANAEVRAWYEQRFEIITPTRPPSGGIPPEGLG